jgi:hypothetical protein
VLFVLWGLYGPVGALVAKAIGPAAPVWLGRYGPAEFMFELTIRYLPAGIVTFIVVSLLTPPTPRQKVDNLAALLRTPVGREQELIDAGVPVIYAGSTVPNRLEASHPWLMHWGGAALAAVVCAMIAGMLYLLLLIGR